MLQIANNISVAIATLDRPDALARCLGALLEGDVLPAQILVVDQSRGAETRALVEQRKAPVPVEYVPQQRRGLSASRNAGIDRARCPIIAFTDDDCVPDQAWVGVMARAFAEADPPDLLTGRVLPLGPEAPGLYVVSPREHAERVDFRGKATPWYIGTGGNCAVKREWFGEAGVYDERLGAGSPGRAAEDADLFYRMLRAGAHIRYEPDAIVYHERQSKARRMASRWSYGYGVGAFCGIWARKGDRYMLHLLSGWLRHQGRILARSAASRDWMQARQRWLSLRGTVRGFLYGLRIG